MENQMSNPLEIIEETYEDLNMSEVSEEYERQLEFDFDCCEEDYCCEDTYGHTPDDEEYYPEDEWLEDEDEEDE